jgi:hypothetical protein
MNTGIFQAQRHFEFFALLLLFTFYSLSACCVTILHHDPSPPPQTPHCVYSLSRYFGRKVQLGPGKQTAKTWLGLDK